MSEQRFPYGPRPRHLALALSFFGVIGAGFVYLGLAGTEVRLWPLPITASGGPVLALGAVSFAFVAVGAAQIARSRKLGPRELVIGDVFLVAPRSPWTKETLRVERAAIRDVRETEVSGTRVLEIVLDGQTLTLSNRTVGDDGYAAALEWLARAEGVAAMALIASSPRGAASTEAREARARPSQQRKG